MQRFDLPTGSETALQDRDGTLSFNAVGALKAALQCELSRHCAHRPTRILGCLEDSLGSLMALLACPELTDYMPLNPRLRDTEILALAQSGAADVAILSTAAWDGLGSKLRDAGLTVLLWDDLYADARATSQSGAFGPMPEHWMQNAGRLILHTSGTTGAPKRVPITIPAMMQSARNIARHHALQQDDLALNTLPTFHIGAVVDVLMAPYAAGGSVVLTNDRSPEGLYQAICQFRPTWVQIVPTLLMHMVEALSPYQMRDLGASLRFVRSISAPVPEALRARAEELLGCPVVEMYGMTETAGQISTNGREAADRKPGTVGRLGSVPIKILDATGSEVATGRSGEICVSGPTVFHGYEGVPRSEVFFDTWFRTGDVGQLDEEGFLSIKGRLKEMINIGGEKVAPSELEIAALAHPQVKEAAAYALPHDTLGEVSGLTIATREHVDAEAFLDYLRPQIADFKMPRRLRQVDMLPRLPNAKVDRLKIARDAAADADAKTPDSQTLGPLAQKVSALWARQLKSRPPQDDDDFFDMGGDSLSATEFLISLSETLGRDVAPNQLFETPRFGALVRALEQDRPAVTTDMHRAVAFAAQKMAGWPGQVVLRNGLFRGIGTVQNGQSLFWCCPSVAEIDLVRQTFAARRPLYVVRSLNRLRGKSFFRLNKRTKTDFDALAAQLAHEITVIQPEGDICLGGFCGGALVMQHVAQALTAQGRRLKVFISLDHWLTAPLDCPVLHGMNPDHIPQRYVDAALAALHPAGVEIVTCAVDHSWQLDAFAPHSRRFADVLDAPDRAPDRIPPTGWTYAQRSAAHSFKLVRANLPRFYDPGATVPFSITVRNTSDHAWDPFADSGLGLDIRLVNLDGCIRDPYAGFGPLDHGVAPGDTATITGDLRFPNKRVPLICMGQLASQGINNPAPRTTLRVATPRFWRQGVPA